MTMSAKIWTTSALIACAVPAAAVDCGDVTYLGQSFTVCSVDVTTTPLTLHLAGPSGAPLGGFGALADLGTDKTLTFAMNAGMYHDDRRPVGLYIENGIETAPLVTQAGPGNFGLLPNGVLCLNDATAQVIETGTFVTQNPTCRNATQSGPMLVIDGALHPRFIPDSTSKYIRNGVGTSADGTTATFAISNAPVNFHDFGTLFRDHLQTPNALYFDGNISRLYAPQINRDDFGLRLGPMIAVFE